MMSAQDPRTPAPAGRTEGTPHATPDRNAVVTVRPLASPLPLAFFGLAIASFLIAMMQVGVVPMSEQRTLYLLIAVFVGPAQAVSALLSFQTREPLVASGIGLIALLWPTTAVVTFASPMGEVPKSLGLLYIAVGAALALMATAALLAKPLLGITLLISAGRFVLNGIFDLTMSNDVDDASAIAGFVLVVLATYAALAIGLEDVRHKTVLPTFRRGEAKEAFNGDLSFQLASVATEAGVRRQL